MKSLQSILVLSLLLFVMSCGRTSRHSRVSPHEDLLYQMECLQQIIPDSVLKVLDNLDVAELSEQEMAHYNLVRAQTLGMLRSDPKAIDSLLSEAESYYSKSNDKYHEAMTYWQKSGVGGRLGYGGQYVLDYRLKALQTIERCKHVDMRLVEYSIIPTNEQNEIDRLKYGIHQRLGMSYTANGYHREGIKHLLLSEQYYYKQRRYNLHLGSAYMLGHAYNLVAEYDSSLLYYQKGLQSAQLMGDVVETAYYYDAVGEGLLYRYDMQADVSDDERMQMLRQSVVHSLKGLKILANVDDRMATAHRLEMFENLSRAYFNLQDYDSCVYYGRKVFDIYGDKTSEFQLKLLYKAYKALGDAGNASMFADILLNLPDDHGQEQKAIAEVKDEYEKRLEISQLQSEQRIKRYRLYLWIAILVIVLLVMLWMVLRMKSNREQARKEQGESLLKRVLVIYADHPKNARQRIMNEFDATYPHAHDRILAAYPDLTEQEYEICVLSYLPFRSKEIAQLFDVQENTIYRYRTVIRKKVGTDDLGALVGRFLG